MRKCNMSNQVVNYQLYLGNPIVLNKLLKKEYKSRPNILKLLCTQSKKIQANWGKINNLHQKKIAAFRHFIESDKGYYRPTNEDEHIYEPITATIYGLKHQGLLFGVMDGHGGGECSQYIKHNFPSIFTQKLEKIKNVKNAFYKAVQDINAKFTQESESNAGSCMCMNYLYLDVFRKCWILYTCNIGDSRTVIFENKTSMTITRDHKPTLDAEIIRKNGGTIINGRLNGNLAVSRALGDRHLQNRGLSAYPDIFITVIPHNGADILVACDGIWDVLDNGDIYRCIKIGKQDTRAPPLNIARVINEEAIRRNTRDNVSNVYVNIH